MVDDFDDFIYKKGTHVCATMDKQAAKTIYRNGEKISYCANHKGPESNIPSVERTQAYIGRNVYGNRRLKGKVAQLLVLDGKSLTSHEVKTLHEDGIPPSDAWLGRSKEPQGCFVERGNMVLLSGSSSPSTQMQQACKAVGDCRSAEPGVQYLIRSRFNNDTGMNSHYWPMLGTAEDAYEQWNPISSKGVSFVEDSIKGVQMKVAKFEGKDARIVLPPLVHGGTGSYSICGYVKHEEVLGTYDIFKIQDGEDTLDQIIFGGWTSTNTRVRFRGRSDSAPLDECQSQENFFSIDRWTHFCAVISFADGKRTYNIYKDGSLIQSCTRKNGDGQLPVKARDTAVIGENLKGSLSQILVLDGYALSKSQVKHVYENGSPRHHPDLTPQDSPMKGIGRILSSKIADNTCALEEKANSNEVYTKLEVDEKLQKLDYVDHLLAKANKTNVYGKSDIDSKLSIINRKINETYTKSDIDAKLQKQSEQDSDISELKKKIDEIYTKSEIDAKLPKNIDELQNTIEKLKEELKNIKSECKIDSGKSRRSAGCTQSSEGTTSSSQSSSESTSLIFAAGVPVAIVVVGVDPDYSEFTDYGDSSYLEVDNSDGTDDAYVEVKENNAAEDHNDMYDDLADDAYVEVKENNAAEDYNDMYDDF
eukprot:UC4_evm1s102